MVYRLTGEKVIDRHTATHFLPLVDINALDRSNCFADEIVSLDKLPRMGWSDELAGLVSSSCAAETGLKVGTPVAVGAVDALSECISMGVLQVDDLMVMYGSTAFFILVLDKPVPDERMWTVGGSFSNQYNLAAGMATTGSLTRWFRDELAADLPDDNAYQTLFDEINTVAPGSNGIIFLPYFSGERNPINDHSAGGLIIGLNLTHKRKHLYMAFLEGVAYGICHNIETFNDIGAPVKRVVAVGGGTQSKDWMQIDSDVAGIEQIVPAQTVGASYGDAFLAGLAAGILKRESISDWVLGSEIIQPDPDFQQVYQSYYQDYPDLYIQNKEIMHHLAAK